MRFYFYNIRKRVLMRLTTELGYNVLQTDTDVAFFANPYPMLKRGVLAEHHLVVQARRSPYHPPQFSPPTAILITHRHGYLAHPTRPSPPPSHA